MRPVLLRGGGPNSRPGARSRDGIGKEGEVAFPIVGQLDGDVFMTGGGRDDGRMEATGTASSCGQEFERAAGS